MPVLFSSNSKILRIKNKISSDMKNNFTHSNNWFKSIKIENFDHTSMMMTTHSKWFAIIKIPCTWPVFYWYRVMNTPWSFRTPLDKEKCKNSKNKTNTRLKYSNNLKKLISSFSHELRTPLNSAILFLRACLIDDESSDYKKKYIEPCLSSLVL